MALIEKTVDQSDVQPGQTLAYSINVNSPGSAILTNVVVTDDIRLNGGRQR